MGSSYTLFFRGVFFGGQTGFCSAKEIFVVSFATQPRAFIMSDRYIFLHPPGGGGGEQQRGLMSLGLFLLFKVWGLNEGLIA